MPLSALCQKRIGKEINHHLLALARREKCLRPIETNLSKRHQPFASSGINHEHHENADQRTLDQSKNLRDAMKSNQNNPRYQKTTDANCLFPRKDYTRKNQRRIPITSERKFRRPRQDNNHPLYTWPLHSHSKSLLWKCHSNNC